MPLGVWKVRYNEGVSLHAIQDLMRHRSYESTLVYAHLSPDYLKSKSAKFSLDIQNIEEDRR